MRSVPKLATCTINVSTFLTFSFFNITSYLKNPPDFCRVFVRTHSAVLFAIRRVILLRSFIVLCTVLLSFGQFCANKITLKPQGFNITFDISKISLQILICNITYTYRKKWFLDWQLYFQSI